LSEIDDESLRLLKLKKEEELKRAMLAAEEEKRLEEQRAVKKVLSRLVFTPEARERLQNLKLVKPALAEELENYLISLAQNNKIKMPIGDEELKAILEKIASRKRETKIWRL
jgi:programmed cell death protein 5